MIDLVLNAHREQAIGLQLELFSLYVLCPDLDARSSLDFI